MATSVSIIIFDPQAHDGLPRLRHSLARQTTGLHGAEVFVATSRPGVDEMREQWPTLLPGARVEIARVNPSASGGAVRNLALSRAQGELTLCLGPEIRLDPAFLALQSDLLRETGADLCYGDYVRMGLPPEGLVRTRPFVHGMLARTDCLGPTLLVRREVLDAVGGFRENTAYDQWDFRIQADLAGCRFIRSPRPLATVEIGKPSFRQRAEDARAKALMVLNNTAYFDEAVVRWALSHLRGASWARTHHMFTLPDPGEVRAMYADKVRATSSGLLRPDRMPEAIPLSAAF